MAKDYNQVLLDKGYTQEQIDAMTSAVSSGQNAMDVVRNMNSSMGNTQSPAATQSQTSSSSSGGRYVYDPVSEYYVLEGSTNNQTTPTVQQQTTTTQTQNQGSTVTGTQQQGALKPLSQDYYNQTSDEALSTIRDNLNRYRQTNPEYFTDYDSFKRNFSYDSRNEAQKNELDTWYKGYQQQLQLSSVPTTDLYTQYMNGQISATELEGLRISNPTKYAELQAQINKGNVMAAYDDNKGVDTKGMTIQDMAYNMATQIFTKFMSGDTGSEATQFFRDYENKMESPEMVELSDQCTEVQEQMENIQSDLDAIKKTVEAEYEGTGASRAKINAIISDRSYDLQLQLRTLNSEYNKYATQYNNRMQQYQNEFQLQLQEYQINQQARQQQMSELGFALDLMSFETPQQAQEREWNYRVKQQEYTNGNINSSDYQTRYKAALSSVQNLLSQYQGIPMVRSAEQMAQDILKAIDGGSDLGTELTKINKQIQNKPEYKYLYNQTFRPTTSAQGFGNTISIGGTDYVEYNGQLYTAEEFNKKYGGVSGPTQTTNGGVSYNPVTPQNLSQGLYEWINKYKSGAYGGQCGYFVNNYLESLGLNRVFGNSVESKTNAINVDPRDINNLSVGSIAVFDYSNVGSVSKNAQKYGHVGIVTEIDYQRGRVKLLESNLKGDEKTTSTRWVDINSPVLKGYFDPSKGSVPVVDGGTSVTTTTTVGGLSDSQITQLAKDYINNERSYSDIAKTYGDDVLNAVGLKASQLQEGGYTKSTKITDPSKVMNAEQNLMTKFNSMNDGNKTALKRVNIMNEALSSIAEDKKNDKKTLNGASQAIVNAYNKILDEKSVVRESEYARTPEGQAFFDKLQGKLEQFTKGGAGLTYKNLKGLVDLANVFAETYQMQQDNLVQLIRNQADTYGLNISNILPLEYLNTTTISTGYSIDSIGQNLYSKYGGYGMGSTVFYIDGRPVTRG